MVFLSCVCAKFHKFQATKMWQYLVSEFSLKLIVIVNLFMYTKVKLILFINGKHLMEFPL